VLLRFGLVVSILGGIAASAHAQDVAPSDQAADGDASDAVARGLFQAGAAAFDAGQFAEALEHFQAAYARSPRPKLLYNIGQAADRLRQDELALDSFRRYLAEVPDAEGREAIEARVRVLEQAVSEKKAAEPPPEPLPTEPAEHETGPSDPVPSEPAADGAARPFPWAPVAVLGAGVVAIVAGGAFGMTAKSE
jgi:tetratricopeptide (TPR) repeat protein